MSDFYDLMEGTPRTSNGSTSEFKIKHKVRDLEGNSERQIFTVGAQGTWDGATLKLEFSFDGGTVWHEDSNLTFTANGSSVSELSRNTLIRATLSSAGASTSVSMYIG